MNIHKNKVAKLKKRAGDLDYIDPTYIGLDPETSKKELEFKQSKSRELYLQRQGKVKERFKKWLNEERVVKGTIPSPDYVIAEVFHYKENNVTEGGILLETMEGSLIEEALKIYPVVKILKGDYPSKFALIPTSRTKAIKSKEWEAWLKDVTEQPSLKHQIPEPPRYVGKLLDWSDYMIQLNPLEENSELDHYTFCLPSRFLQLNLTLDDALTYIN